MSATCGLSLSVAFDLLIDFRRRHIVFRGVANAFRIAVSDLPFDLCRLPHDDAAGRDLGAFSDDTADGDDAAAADFGTVHHYGSHADEAIVLDSRAVHNCTVAQRNPVADGAGKVRISMQDRAVLHVSIAADANRCTI